MVQNGTGVVGTTHADFEEDRSMFICCVYCRVSLHVKAELCSLMAVNQAGLATLVEKRRRWETTITWRWEHTLFFPSAGKSSDSKLSLWSLAWFGSCVVLWKRGGWYDWNGNALPVSALLYLIFYYLKKSYFEISTVWTFRTLNKTFYYYYFNGFEVSYANQSCNYVNKGTVNTVILCNIINIKKSPFYLDTILNIIYPCDFKAVFSASLLQSSVSHDTSEIIIICWFTAQETFCIYVCMHVQLRSKVYIHLAESAKCSLFYQNKRDHPKCMLFFYLVLTWIRYFT